MEIITNIINTTLNSFDFAYCITVNILTYLLINIINNKSKSKIFNTWSKRIVLITSIIIVSIYYILTGSDTKLILNSAIVSPVFWSWIMKPICKHFNIDYKDLHIIE